MVKIWLFLVRIRFQLRMYNSTKHFNIILNLWLLLRFWIRNESLKLNSFGQISYKKVFYQFWITLGWLNLLKMSSYVLNCWYVEKCCVSFAMLLHYVLTANCCSYWKWLVMSLDSLQGKLGGILGSICKRWTCHAGKLVWYLSEESHLAVDTCSRLSTFFRLGHLFSMVFILLSLGIWISWISFYWIFLYWIL